MLELAFATKELRSVCEDAACAEAAYGPFVAQALVGRLADLRASGHALDLPFASIRDASGSDSEQVIVTLAAGRTIVIAANHPTTPRAADGTVRWEHVSRVIILRLE